MEQLSYVTTATMTRKGIANGKELDSCARGFQQETEAGVQERGE